MKSSIKPIKAKAYRERNHRNERKKAKEAYQRIIMALSCAREERKQAPSMA